MADKKVPEQPVDAGPNFNSGPTQKTEPDPKTQVPQPTNEDVRAAAYYDHVPSTKNVGFATDHDPPPSPDWGKSRAAAAVNKEQQKETPKVEEKALDAEKKGSYKNRAMKSE